MRHIILLPGIADANRKLDLLLAGSGITPTPTPTPVFTTAASIASDGTPQVGEMLTGNDGTITNGTVSARAWLLAGTIVGTGQTFAPTQTGVHTYRVTATGSGGTATSSAAVTVGAATAPAPTFQTSPSITTDGTPQVGETLTGVDGTIANGTVSGRRWLFNGSQVATTSDYVPTQTGVYTFEVTATGAGGTATGASTVTVAAAGVTTPMTIAFAGSSTPEHAISLYGSTANGDDRVTYSPTGTSFQRLNTGRFGQDLGKLLADSTGRAVRLLHRGVGGTTLVDWDNDANGVLTNLVNAIAAAGGCDAVWLQVGRNDIAAGSPVSKAAHLARLRSLIGKIRTRTGISQLMIFLGISQDTQPATEMTYVRQAEMTVINNDSYVRILHNQSDLLTNDGTHVEENAYAILAMRAHLQMRAFFMGTPQIRGPRITSVASVTTTTTDVTFTHGNGSGFNPTSGSLGFAVYDSGGALLSGTVTGEAQSGTVVRVTHPAGAQTLTVHDVPLTATAGQSDPSALKDNGAVPLMAEPSETFVSIGGAQATPVTISGTPPQATSGQSYSYVPTTTGGNGTKTFALTGTLPAGFLFSTATGAITAASGNAAAAGSYNLTISVTSGNTATQSFTLTVLAAAGSATPTGKRALVTYDDGASPAVTGFNNRPASSRASAVSLVSPTGTALGWTDRQVTTTNGGTGATGASTGNNTGVYPDAAMITYWFASAEVIDHEWAGLDDTKAYDVILFASRAAADRSTQFTIGGVAQTLDASNNTMNTVKFLKVRPSGGKILMTWQKGTIGAVTSGFSYLNVAEIIEYSL